MSNARFRGKAISAEDLRASLWFWPTAAALTALALTFALLQVRPEATWAGWLWPQDSQSASTLLQTVATAVMTAATLTFSLTVVALQLASQQFSPRLLRDFARDRFTQVVLGVLISTVVVALTGIRGTAGSEPVPVFVVALAYVMAIASAGLLLAFVGHIVRALRVDTMMVAVHREAVATIEQTYLSHDDLSKVPRDDLPGPEGGIPLTAQRSGFIRVIRPEVLVEGAQKAGAFLRFGIRPGDHVVEGTPIGSVWGRESAADPDDNELQRALNVGVEVGFERTIEQDSALALRQLVDIAVKAISPSINDPVTAAHAVGYCADLLGRLQQKHLGAQQHDDTRGVPRLVLPDRDQRYYVDLVCGPIRRYGRQEPIVLCALLAMLRDCMTVARDDRQRAELLRQTQLIVEQTSEQLLPEDVERVEDLARRVHLAAEGDIDAAYRDRAGETRSA